MPFDGSFRLLLLARIAKAEKDWGGVEQRAKGVLKSGASRFGKARAYSLLLSVYEQQRNWEAEDICHRSIVNLEPESAWAKGNHAAFLSRRERYDEAIDWAQKAVSQRDYPMGRRTLAKAHYGKGAVTRRKDAAGACALFEKSLKMYPMLSEGYYGRGMCQWEEGRRRNDRSKLAAAEKSFHKAIELDPEWESPKKALVGLKKEL